MKTKNHVFICRVDVPKGFDAISVKRILTLELNKHGHQDINVSSADDAVSALQLGDFSGVSDRVLENLSRIVKAEQKQRAWADYQKKLEASK